MDRADHSEDGHSELTHAAFNTIALVISPTTTPASPRSPYRWPRAISRLPAPQLDGTLL
ncbi:hypothetical protein QF037_000705 [Streptomyces canus]|uniref:hypothetical protein n=1 Tax=Streptomyces canus TaxID=58343 RepID=UPI0027807898|nr:hypothetical protein [Streptomyces canus]MDQ0596360.1 hypothetical protein [Streptomyces canus]